VRNVERSVLVILMAVCAVCLLAGCGARPEAAPLTDEGVKSLDLEDGSRYQPIWVKRVEDCEVTLEPDGSVLCQVRGSDDASGGQYGGVRLNTGPLSAVEIELTIVNPDSVSGVWVTFGDTVSRGETERWHWGRPQQPSSKLVFRPGQESSPFTYGGSRDRGSPNVVDVFIKLTGLNARAGLALREVRYLPSAEGAATEAPGSPAAEPPAAGEANLEGSGVVGFDLGDAARREPTWAVRVQECTVGESEEGSLTCEVQGSDDTSGGQYGGVRFLTGPISAVEFELSFIRPEEIDAVFVDLRNIQERQVSERWAWRSPHKGLYSPVFQTGSESQPFEHHEVTPDITPDCVDLFIRLRGTNAEAGFTVTRMRYKP